MYCVNEFLFFCFCVGFRVEVEGIEGSTSWQDLKDFAREAGSVVYADIEMVKGKKLG
jgi:hypothetical protein